MAKKLYLVTGGSGFIGAALCRAIVKAGHRVRILDNQSRGSLRRLTDIEGEYEFIEGDIRELDSVNKAVKGVDSVCHLAFVNGTEFFYSKPDLVLDVGVKGMVNVIDACIKHNIPELVLASSSEVYQTPKEIPTPENAELSIPDVFNPRYSYAAGKIISEIMAINYGRKHFERVMIFRPHNVYGPDMGWEHVIPQFVLRMKKLASESKDTVQFPLQGTGKEIRSFIYIDDFIDGVMLMLDSGQHMNLYHIGTQNEVTMAELAEMVGKYFARQIEIVSSPGAEGGTLRRCPKIDKIKTLGFSPKISLKQGIDLTAHWYANNEHLHENK